MTKSSPSIWHLLSKCQINGEDFLIFCGLLRKHELYRWKSNFTIINKSWCLIKITRTKTRNQSKLVIIWPPWLAVKKESPMEKKYFCTVWIIFLKTTRKNCCLFIVTLRKLAFLLGNLCLHVEPKSTLFIACLAPAMYYISHGCYVYRVAWFLEKLEVSVLNYVSTIVKF